MRVFKATSILSSLGTIVLLLIASSLLRADDSKENGFTSLFDGKTFEGWEGNLDVFRIEDGAVMAGSTNKPVARNEFLCTKKEFGDFELRLKFKLVGEGANAGVQIRTKRIPNHHEVSGYQADMGDGWWGSLYDESRRNKILAKADEQAVLKVLKRADWNDYRILCEGPRIRLWINDLPTIDYTEAEDKIERTGIIGLQIHGGPPSQASYKDIRIKKL